MDELKQDVTVVSITEDELQAASNDMDANDKERKDFAKMIVTQLLSTDCSGGKPNGKSK